MGNSRNQARDGKPSRKAKQRERDTNGDHGPVAKGLRMFWIDESLESWVEAAEQVAETNSDALRARGEWVAVG